MSDVKRKAYELFQKGEKTKSIAEKLDISYSTLRSWISRGKWKESVETIKIKKERVATDKKVLQQNKNDATKNKASPVKSVALLNNNNAVKHGVYEKIMYSTMTEEEILLISEQDLDEIEELEREKNILTVRELKYMKLLKALKDSEKNLVVVGVDKIVKSTVHKGVKTTEFDFSEETKEISERTVYAFELINKYESELTRIQKQKSKVIEAIAKIKNDREMLFIAKEKLELEKLKLQTSESTEDKLDKLFNSIQEAFENED